MRRSSLNSPIHLYTPTYAPPPCIHPLRTTRHPLCFASNCRPSISIYPTVLFARRVPFGLTTYWQPECATGDTDVGLDRMGWMGWGCVGGRKSLCEFGLDGYVLHRIMKEEKCKSTTMNLLTSTYVRRALDGKEKRDAHTMP
jgi:hypothetical protein